MTLSIIIPVYKVEEYLRTCIDSVLAACAQLSSDQTYEIICVDDGSPDNCPKILDVYQQEFMDGPNSFKVIHKPNGGLSDARNAGMDIATGEYIYFLDSDDSITPDTFTGMLEQVRQHPGVDMVVAGAMTSEGSHRFSSTRFTDFPDYTKDQEWIKCMMILQNIPMVAWNKLLRKEMLEKSKMHFEVGMYNEDEPWNWMLAKEVKSMALYKRDTYNYLIRQGSIINNPMLASKCWKHAIRRIHIFIDNIDDYLPCVQRFWVYYVLFGWWLAPQPCSTPQDVKLLFAELAQQCSARQRMAIWLTTHLPLKLQRSIGPLQSLLIDFFGQSNCAKYDDRGLRRYLKLNRMK